jgi:hypothetical protein
MVPIFFTNTTQDEDEGEGKGGKKKKKMEKKIEYMDVYMEFGLLSHTINYGTKNMIFSHEESLQKDVVFDLVLSDEVSYNEIHFTRWLR